MPPREETILETLHLGQAALNNLQQSSTEVLRCIDHSRRLIAGARDSLNRIGSDDRIERPDAGAPVDGTNGT